MTWKI